MFVGWDELHAGGWDPAARLVEQDRDGVATEVLYPSVGMLLCNHPDADYKKACFDSYNLWITDFGLARAAADSSTSQSGMIAGTPQYMSPEQARGDAVDCRADLKHIGVADHAAGHDAHV